MTFDLSTLDTAKTADQGAMMEVLHPATSAPLLADDGAPLTITLTGEDSARLTAFDRAARDRLLARAAANPGRPLKRTAAELDKDALDRLVVATVTWSAGFALDGEALPYSQENAGKLYRRLPWLREQAQAFIADRSNFLKA